MLRTLNFIIVSKIIVPFNKIDINIITIFSNYIIITELADTVCLLHLLSVDMFLFFENITLLRNTIFNWAVQKQIHDLCVTLQE